DVVIAAEASQIPLKEFAFSLTLPISIVAIVSMAIAHYFWQRFLDRKEDIKSEILDVKEITTNAPKFYAILPFMPIIGVLLF
ncbi:anaerobic C4-dicarboxylate transporter DcuC, partial [Klebsiella pneumoniae]|nr:anaerobic C4-dicarboxylate transporter DcuC [Klebsiella pneumoniae]